MTVSHQTIPASDLRDGDLLRLGASTNYVLVADAALPAERAGIAVDAGRQAVTAVQPFTTATLTIDRSGADVVLTDGGWKPNQPYSRHTVALGMHRDNGRLGPIADLRRDADVVLGAVGYARTGDWTTTDDGYTAPIKETS